MKAPLIPDHHPSQQAENLYNEYKSLSDNKEDKTVETKRNFLLTPFLLTIPIILILFILISNSDASETTSSEPIQREVVTIHSNNIEPINSVITTDSLINSNRIALPAKR